MSNHTEADLREAENYRRRQRYAEKKRLKEEAERLERERLEYIESQKKAIMEKAKAKGYRVMETKKDNKIQLTLVRY